jgi:cytoskeletal protein RodZ
METMDRDKKPGAWVSWPDLTELRRSRKISVDQIAARTKINAAYLTAIEQGDFKKLPGGVYTTSYIRQYARAIDFPEHDLLLRFNALMGTSIPAPLECQESPSPQSSGPRFLRWLSSFVF